jgi:glyoxylase-like metal-dependent hydrolase (beta-lactamase superfamily II)
LYDLKQRHFFSGDVVYDGVLLDELEDSVVDDYVSSMERLLQLKTDEVRPGHYHSFSFGRRRLQELVTQYINEKKAPLCPADG